MRTTDINLQRSTLFISLLVSVVVISDLLLISLPAGWALKALIMLLTTGYGFHIIWRYGLLKGNNTPLSLSKNLTGWQITTRADSFSTELCGDSTVTTLVSVLRFRVIPAKSIYSCVIFCDALATNTQYRHLIAQIRTSHAHSSEHQRRNLPTA